MQKINHHLNDQLLMGYASGVLPEAFDVVVATHISMCDECRARAATFESLGGAVLETTDMTSVSDTCLEETLRLISQSTPEPAPKAAAPKHTVLPQPLYDYVGGDLDAVKWRSIGGGVKQAVIPTSRDATVRLLSIPGGARMPDHGHRGTELTMVLQGAFVDESDRFARGDIEIANEELEHTPVAEPGMTCICLAATDAPLKFNTWLPRIVQPFVGI